MKKNEEEDDTERKKKVDGKAEERSAEEHNKSLRLGVAELHTHLNDDCPTVNRSAFLVEHTHTTTATNQNSNY